MATVTQRQCGSGDLLLVQTRSSANTETTSDTAYLSPRGPKQNFASDIFVCHIGFILVGYDVNEAVCLAEISAKD